MARSPYIDEAVPTSIGTVALRLERCPIGLKRALCLLAANQGLYLREVLLRALQREVLENAEAAGLEPTEDVASPDN